MLENPAHHLATLHCKKVRSEVHPTIQQVNQSLPLDPRCMFILQLLHSTVPVRLDTTLSSMSTQAAFLTHKLTWQQQAAKTVLHVCGNTLQTIAAHINT